MGRSNEVRHQAIGSCDPVRVMEEGLGGGNVLTTVTSKVPSAVAAEDAGLAGHGISSSEKHLRKLRGLLPCWGACAASGSRDAAHDRVPMTWQQKQLPPRDLGTAAPAPPPQPSSYLPAAAAVAAVPMFPRAPSLLRTRVEPKTFFAAERTFLAWVNIAVLVSARQHALG
jgi:hypothetical protein